MPKFALFTLFLIGAASAAVPSKTPRKWTLVKSTLTYHVSDPLHQVYGVSHAVRGKGVCHAGECSFLAAAPVNSFHSGDTNRDLHMIQTVRGGANPLVVVRASIPESAIHPGALQANLQVQFAGKTVTYKNVQFQLAQQGSNLDLTGTIPAKLSDFRIPPPEFLFITIKNAIPVAVNLLWHGSR